MELIVVRHTSVDVEQGTCYGQSDVPVRRDTFQSEAEAVKSRLDRYDLKDAVVLCSPLQRCRLLCKACGFDRQAIYDKALMERSFGLWEMCLYDRIQDQRLQEWFGDWINVRPPEGESFADMVERVRDVIMRMEREGVRRSLWFTHGGVAVAAMVVSGMSPAQAFAAQPRYGGIIRLTI